jgi:hypothetical protein
VLLAQDLRVVRKEDDEIMFLRLGRSVLGFEEQILPFPNRVLGRNQAERTSSQMDSTPWPTF